MACHLYSELRSTLCSCGETTRETMACCAPGGTNCQHPGQWRETAVGTRVCEAGALPGHPDACAHKPDADMARSHWSCCADLNRASNTCLRQPTHAHTHPGDWRVSSAKRYTKHCSPTWEVEGRVCKHGAVIQASHWSWYVWIMRGHLVFMIGTVFSRVACIIDLSSPAAATASARALRVARRRIRCVRRARQPGRGSALRARLRTAREPRRVRCATGRVRRVAAAV